MADSVSVIANRLIRTRKALGYETQIELADEIGIPQNNYNTFEKGRRRISLGAALKMWDRFGVSLDWIYCGDASGVTFKRQKMLASGKPPLLNRVI